jgi:hypothetical protein
VPIRSLVGAARPPRASLAIGLAAAIGSTLFSLSLAPPVFGAAVSASTDQAALQTQTLTLSDLPQGWKATTSASSSGGATSSCGGRPFGASQRIAQTQVSFQDPSGLPELFEQISDYNSPSTVFAKGVRDLNRCHNVSISQSGSPLKIHVAKLAYRAGRLTAAYALSFVLKSATVGKSEDVGIDVVLVRVGNEIAEVGLADVPSPPVSQLRSFVAKAIADIKKHPQSGG